MNTTGAYRVQHKFWFANLPLYTLYFKQYTLTRAALSIVEFLYIVMELQRITKIDRKVLYSV